MDAISTTNSINTDNANRLLNDMSNVISIKDLSSSMFFKTEKNKLNNLLGGDNAKNGDVANTNHTKGGDVANANHTKGGDVTSSTKSVSSSSVTVKITPYNMSSSNTDILNNQKLSSDK